MKSWTFTLGIALALAASGAAQAEDSADAAASAEGAPFEIAADEALPEPEVADAVGPEESLAPVVEVDEVVPETLGDDVVAAEERGFDEAASPEPQADLVDDAEAADVVTQEAVAAAVAEAMAVEFVPVESGSAAVDTEGRRGRIHVVTRGDTLWDISDTYLHTPWVWPAIWKQNEDIANPHRIYPGDHIWISATEMRRVTPAEAAEMVAAEAEYVEQPAAPALPLGEEPLPVLEDVPAAMDQDETLISVAPTPAAHALKTLPIPARGNMSFVSQEMLDASSSIVSSPSPRTWLSEGDMVVLGLGEGETEVGERYDVFSEIEPVRDDETGHLYGYHVRVLGWVEVREVHGDTATAEIRSSVREMERGTSIVPRDQMPVEVGVLDGPSDFEGKIIFAPADRTQMSMLDYVYLNRGSVHGLEAGSHLEVYETGEIARDRVRGRSVQTPDRNIADLIIVKVQPTTSVAFIIHSRRELEVGDTVRATSRELAMR